MNSWLLKSMGGGPGRPPEPPQSTEGYARAQACTDHR